MRTTLFLLITLRFWRDVFWHSRPRPCTGAVSATADTMPRHLTHVRLTDQFSLYIHQICRLRSFLISPEESGDLQCMKLMFDPFNGGDGGLVVRLRTQDRGGLGFKSCQDQRIFLSRKFAPRLLLFTKRVP